MKVLKFLFLLSVLFLFSGFLHSLYYHIPLYQPTIIFIIYSIAVYSLLTFQKTAYVKNQKKQWFTLLVSWLLFLLAVELLDFLEAAEHF